MGSGTLYKQQVYTISMDVSKSILCPILMMSGFLVFSVLFKAAPQILPDLPSNKTTSFAF